MLLTGLLFFAKTVCALEWVCIRFSMFTFKKLECSKQAISGPILLVSRTKVMIKRDNWGNPYFIVRGEILGFTKDEQLRKHVFSINQVRGLKTIRYCPSSNHKQWRLGTSERYRTTPLTPTFSGKYGCKAEPLRPEHRTTFYISSQTSFQWAIHRREP